MSYKDYEVNPCPKCNGDIRIYLSMERGVLGECKQCKSEFPVCPIKDIRPYKGGRIRRSTIKKTIKLWNIRQAQLLEQSNCQGKMSGIQELK